MKSNKQIRFEKVSVRFEEKPVLDNFSLTINQGDKIIFQGASGTGKSTILKLLLGVVQPESGAIYIDDQVLEKEAVWDFRKQVAYVPQDCDIHEGPVWSIIDEIFSFKVNKKNSGPGAVMNMYHDRIVETLRFFDLGENVLDKKFEELSGGEKQRVVIVLALIREKRIYMLDEITSALDGEMKRKVADSFMSMADSTLLVVSHDELWSKYKNSITINLE